MPHDTPQPAPPIDLLVIGGGINGAGGGRLLGMAGQLQSDGEPGFLLATW